MLNKYLLNWMRSVRNRRMWNCWTLKLCRFRRIVKLSERCLTINTLEEGLKLCACGGRGNRARKRAPSQKFGAAWLPPCEDHGPHLGGELALPPRPDTWLPHRCFLLSYFGLPLSPQLVKDTQSWVAYGTLLSSKEKTTRSENDSKNITQD